MQYSDHKKLQEYIKRESKKQPFLRKIRNHYLGIKYRIQDIIYKLKKNK